MAKIAVAPLVGAWIEIITYLVFFCLFSVAPLVGAWIEIRNLGGCLSSGTSLPSWERGLKFIFYLLLANFVRRSPRGSVD